MMTGAESKPSTSRPHSSFTDGFMGPRGRDMPTPRAQARTASMRSRLTEGSSTDSKNPKKAVPGPWRALWCSSTTPATEPTSRPFRVATHRVMRA
jgi:hypothetical protein